MNKVLVLPRSEFQNRIDEFVERDDVIISIEDYRNPLPHILTKDNCNNYILNINFDDINEERYMWVGPDPTDYLKQVTKEQIQEIDEAVDYASKQEKRLVVHCTAGQSRSKAVGEYARTVYGYVPEEEIFYYNGTVLMLLKKFYYRKHGFYQYESPESEIAYLKEEFSGKPLIFMNSIRELNSITKGDGYELVRPDDVFFLEEINPCSEKEKYLWTLSQLDTGKLTSIVGWPETIDDLRLFPKLKKYEKKLQNYKGSS
jgi:predicted protein tyrosine phosphatase